MGVMMAKGVIPFHLVQLRQRARQKRPRLDRGRHSGRREESGDDRSPNSRCGRREERLRDRNQVRAHGLFRGLHIRGSECNHPGWWPKLLNGVRELGLHLRDEGSRHEDSRRARCGESPCGRNRARDHGRDRDVCVT